MDRDTRRLHQNKAERPQVLSRFPSNASGSDGDVVYVKNGTTVSQAIKSAGQWLMIGEGSPVSTRSKSTVTPRTFVIGGGGSAEGAVLQNGSTPFLAVQRGIEPTLDDHLATKSYVDSSSASSGWTMAADSGSNQVLLAGNTGTFSGGTGVSTAASATDTLTISIGQAVGTSDAVTFATVNTGQGANELYDMNQNVLTSSAVTFATVDTGQGANELYDMDQNVTTGSSPTFNDLTTDGDITVKGDDISSHPFTSGFTGSGWKIDNTGHAEFANATIRGSLSVFELLMQQLRATNGSVIITAVAKVESIDGNDILFEDPSDNGICPFHTNDIVMVQRVNLTGSATGDNGGGSIEVVKRLVRRVTGVSGRTITVTRDGDLPTDTGSFAVGDDVVRIGNTTNTARDAVLYLSADDSKAPYIVIKDGVDSWANFGSADTEKVRLGRLDGITDTTVGLSGSQSNVYGLYSDDVYLKGHINATSGSIGGVDISNGSLSISASDISDVNAYTTDQDKQTFSSATMRDTPSGSGLFLDATHLGYYQNSAWTSYLGSNGDFLLQKDSGASGTGSLTWDSSAGTLAIRGSITIDNIGSISQTSFADSAAAGATVNSSDADLKNRSNHTGTQDADSLDSTVISGGKIITGLLTANNIQAGTLTGRTVQTSASGQRVIIHEDDKLEFYDASNLILQIEADNSDPSVRLFHEGALYCSGDGSIVGGTGISYSSYRHTGLSVTNREDNASSGCYVLRSGSHTGDMYAGFFSAQNTGSGQAIGLHVDSGTMQNTGLGWTWLGNYARDIGYGGSDGGVLNVRGYTDDDPNDTAFGQAIKIWNHGNSSYVWSINVDEDFHLSFRHGTSVYGGYMHKGSAMGQIDFTGQHRCVGNSGMTVAQYGAMVGYIVRADGQYNNMSEDETSPRINEALPVIELSDSDDDKRVFGVISSHEDGEREYQQGNFVSVYAMEEDQDRVIVNSVGEGGIWVTNLNGALDNGDYITSSTAAGLGQKQADDLLHNYTVAKITQDCDFSSGIEFEHDGETYKKQFVGCTYHCG